MGNVCFKGEGSDGENNYLAGRISQSDQGSSGRVVDREVLAAAAEARLKAQNERGVKTHTVQQKSKADLPEFSQAGLKWQVG